MIYNVICRYYISIQLTVSPTLVANIVATLTDTSLEHWQLLVKSTVRTIQGFDSLYVTRCNGTAMDSFQQLPAASASEVMITAIKGSVAALFWSTMLLLLVLTTMSLFLQMLGQCLVHLSNPPDVFQNPTKLCHAIPPWKVTTECDCR